MPSAFPESTAPLSAPGKEGQDSPAPRVKGILQGGVCHSKKQLPFLQLYSFSALQMQKRHRQGEVIAWRLLLITSSVPLHSGASSWGCR